MVIKIKEKAPHATVAEALAKKPVLKMKALPQALGKAIAKVKWAAMRNQRRDREGQRPEQTVGFEKTTRT